jgi:hypothetical protein
MFTDKVVDVVAVPIPITEKLVESICVTALEGGIGYWAVIDNDQDLYKAYKKKDPEASFSQIMARFLLDGKNFVIYDAEDGEELLGSFTLKNFLKGLTMYIDITGDSKDLEYLDANACDQIFQYGMFGELVYG